MCVREAKFQICMISNSFSHFSGERRQKLTMREQKRKLENESYQGRWHLSGGKCTWHRRTWQPGLKVELNLQSKFPCSQTQLGLRNEIFTIGINFFCVCWIVCLRSNFPCTKTHWAVRVGVVFKIVSSPMFVCVWMCGHWSSSWACGFCLFKTRSIEEHFCPHCHYLCVFLPNILKYRFFLPY